MINFIDHFRAIASNFDWRWHGSCMLAIKNGRYYDPITALVQIAKGEYMPSHHKAYITLGMTRKDYEKVVIALYTPDYICPVGRELRWNLEQACGLLDEEAT